MSLKKEIGLKVGKKVVEGVKKYTGAALRGLGLSGKSRTASGLTHPVIDRLKVKKNLTDRRADRDSVVAGVDKHLKSSDTKSSKIKKEFTKKVSDIYDKQ